MGNIYLDQMNSILHSFITISFENDCMSTPALAHNYLIKTWINILVLHVRIIKLLRLLSWNQKTFLG